MLTMLAKLLKALNSESAPWQIALAFSLALIVALTPTLSLHNAIVLLFAFLLRINLSAFFLGVGAFSLLAVAIDPYSVRLGESLLANPGLQSTWTELYQSDFWRMTAFNHSLVLGGLLIALVAFIPLFIASRVLISLYRDRLLAWANKLKIAQILKGTKFYNLYKSIAE
ncbi:TIGR03546 family protein [Thalassolituus sp. LLYu03]|uniref:TIGR03546 family protein n=1 Tax=Thalassolituus sp. LLYu03 TaxID=3421656 RepID=UPI003D296C2F